MPRSSARGNGSAPEYAELGGKLRGVRLAHGLSLRVLADRLGVSPSLISQVETGRAKPSVSTLYAMSAELGVSLDDLLFPDSGANGRTGGAAAEAGLAPGSSESAGLSGARAGSSGSRVPEPGVRARRPLTSSDLPSGLSPASFPPTDAGLPFSVPPEAMPPVPIQPASSRKRIRLASGVVWERLTTSSIPGVDFLYVTYEVGGASTHEHEFQRHAGQEWGYVISGTLGVTIGFDDYVLGPGDAISFDSMTPHRMRNLGKEPVHGIWFQIGRRGVDTGGGAGHGTVPERPSEAREP